ncbi:hypothetical protein JR316_0010321 [Psilocybe cubensis]|uniref:Uncharacterized protein n=2 Tax=Psilocybe cubensis TaxID=181762 RepID=A0ACB8GQR7_PSICU|nr:hypothetical protein JR316_0010321 [Psilocybe cubensis]KAH9478083.1 hypothetical protein JR316_0010321 [Psilocybe cubensis]
MFSKLSLLTLVSPLVSALTLNVPTGVTSGGHVTITWTTDSNDPSTFTLELNKEEFNKALAIANNVATSAGTLDVTLPPVPNGDGYTLQAVNITNINDVFATSGSFSIAAAPSSSKGASGTGAGSATKGSGSAGATGTSPASSNPTGSAAATGTDSGSAANATSTSPSGSSGGSASASGTSSSAGTNPSTSAAHATRLGGNPAAFAAVLVSVAAGAAMIAL